MAFSTRSGEIKNEINVTPLVDVVLVLLIVFMVVTPLLHQGKDVNLPKARTTEESRKPNPLVVSVTPDRMMWYETTQVTGPILRIKVASALREDPERKILIKGDDSLKVKDIRLVLIRLKEAGAKAVSLAVEELKK